MLKTFLKSVNVRLSYGQKFRGLFLTHSVYTDLTNNYDFFKRNDRHATLAT
jgi:hypothetical protein